MTRSDISQKLIDHRKELELSIYQMAKKVGVASRLIDVLETDGYTLPGIIFNKIMPEYGLTLEEGELLLPENMRPHGNDYEPKRYLNDDATEAMLRGRQRDPDHYDVQATIEKYFGKPTVLRGESA